MTYRAGALKKAACQYYRNVAMRISALVFLLSLLLAAGCDRGDHPRQIGRPAPDFTISDGGRSLQLSTYRGKVVLLNFWASWCAPCILEIPSLNQLQRQMPQLVVLGVDVDKDESAYRQFLARHEVDYLTIRDPQQQTNAIYGTFVFPDTYVIDRSGQIRRKFINAQDWTSPEIVEYLSRL
jgi:cytochrome c biogenesis protein CcmG, thiol:disulfide interchange protein DsbE